VIGEGDARRLRRRVGEERVVNGSEPEKLLRWEGEEVPAKQVDPGGQIDPDLQQIDADDDPLRADLAGEILEP